MVKFLRLTPFAVSCLLSAAAHAQSVTTMPISDPAYGVKAFTATIPSGWKFQGTVIPGPECSRLPFPVFRAYSPDGLQEIRLQPAFNWTFHPNNRAFKGVPGCLNISGPISAADFLKKYEEMVAGNGMHVIGPMPVGASYQAMVTQIGQNMGHISPNTRGSAESAAVRVETPNGTFVIEQRLRVYVECRIASSGPDTNGGGCSAHVDVERAPKGKLDALCNLVDSRSMFKLPFETPWIQLVQHNLAQRAQQDFNNLTHQEKAGDAMIKKQFDDFMATSQRNHEAFMQQQESSFRSHEAAMAQQESSFHSSMNNANAAKNASSTAASDWVDYSLDQQTVTGQGGTVKISSAYNQTWSSTVGNQTTWYQTNDPNANPNGVLPGNWTTDTKVHGNGQPY
jgi:hypothetical protein